MLSLKNISLVSVACVMLLLGACAGQANTSASQPEVENAADINEQAVAQAAAVEVVAAQQTTEPVPSEAPAGMPVNADGETIVARVNSVEILESELNRALARYQSQIEVLDLDALRTDILNSMIEQVLIEQAAAAQNITVSDAEVQAEIDANIQIAGSPEAWQQWLANNLYTEEEFRETLRETLITARMRDIVTQGIHGDVPHVHARHILVATEAEANELLARINNGEDFGALAAAHSSDVTTREQGGDLGWFAQGELLEPYLAEVAFSLEPGQVAGPVATALGFHLIQTLEKADRPIPEEKLPMVAQGQFELWLAGLISQATIEVY